MKFGGLTAVDNVSLQLEPGHVVGLIGPNGAGKTTFVNCISGFVKPVQGSIRIDAQSLGQSSAVKARRLGVARTFQGGRLFSSMTVLENVEVAGISLGMSRTRAASEAMSLLQWVGYQGRPDAVSADIPYVDERRVGIARALIGSPAYLLLDEPAAGMSDAECSQLARLIEEIRDQIGCGVLLIEHNMSLIEHVCNWTHVLDSGSTLIAGKPSQVLRDPAVVAAYLGGEA